MNIKPDFNKMSYEEICAWHDALKKDASLHKGSYNNIWIDWHIWRIGFVSNSLAHPVGWRHLFGRYWWKR